MTDNSNSNSNSLLANDPGELQRILQSLSMLQLRWLIARTEVDTDKEACERIGIAYHSCMRWPNRNDIHRALRLMMYDKLDAARELLKRSMVEAVEELRRELDDPSPRIRQRAAIEILDRTMGRAVQPSIMITAGVDDLLRRIWGGPDGETPAPGPAGDVIDGEMTDAPGLPGDDG